MERANAPLLNNMMGNWKETFALLFRGFAFRTEVHMVGRYCHQLVTECVFLLEETSHSWICKGQNIDSVLRERESCRFLCWVISSMQGSLYHKIQKSSQFYLISWNGKVFSRSLIKCFLTEGACLPGRPAPLSESLREKREKYKNSLQRSHCTTEPPPLLMSEATLHNWRTI